MMLVEDLIKFLSEIDPQARVILSEDAEGSVFRPLAQASYGQYFDYQGNVLEKPDEKNIKCVVLWPRHEIKKG